MRIFALLAIALIAMTAMGCESLEFVPADGGMGHSGHDFTRHYEHSHFGVTNNGDFSVEVIFREGTLKLGLNEMDIIVHDKLDSDVTGGNVSVTPWMPDHGHGTAMVPMVMERGGGTYSARNIDITMPGRWQLKINISNVRTSDEATFEFMVSPAGHMMNEMQSPHDTPVTDMGKTKVVSARQIFHATYETDWPVPMNRIHSWKVWLRTPRREAVTGAFITVSGGMPAHGHGLPTQPIATEGDVPGLYIIDGMKFTMPGMWVVQLHIDTGHKTDTVEFTLMVQ